MGWSSGLTLPIESIQIYMNGFGENSGSKDIPRTNGQHTRNVEIVGVNTKKDKQTQNNRGCNVNKTCMQMRNCDYGCPCLQL